MMNFNIQDWSEEYADYLRDESRREGAAEKICFPKSTDEVQHALRLASKHHWPVTIQGGRTGIAGGCVPDGGLILNLSRMNQIGERSDDLLTVQPGAVLADVRAAIEGSGLFFPSDLTETSASIGGMVANNASGARSFKYGAIRPWIHALDVVLSSGERVQLTRGKNRANGMQFSIGSIDGVFPKIDQPKVKSAAGYFVQPNMDLLDLFIGAEGTLGVITEITIKLMPVPDQMNGLTAFFGSEEQAMQCVEFLRNVQPVSIEFFDFNALELLRRIKREIPSFSDLPDLKPEFHTAIYFEFDCDVPDAVIEHVDKAKECWFSEGEHEIATLKRFRHAIPEAVNMLIGDRKKTVPELTKLGTDMSVPDERLRAVMQMYHAGLSDAGLEYVIFGHIGNNHVHVNIIPRNMEEYEQGKSLYLHWANQIVKWGGSVSAEHGIGKMKTEFLDIMHGKKGLQRMRSLKALFDPEMRLNRGNLFD